MSAKIMLVHPGHSFSTSDVYDGLSEGLRLNGVEVVPFEWQRPLRMMATMTGAAVGTGFVSEAKAPQLEQYGTWLASANAVELALDQDVDAVIVVNGILFPPSRARLLQKLQIPVVCFGTEAPYFLKTEQDIAPFYSHWFTNERRCAGAFPNARYLRHAYNPATHQPGPKDADKAVDAVFVGGGYPERRALLAEQGVTTRGTLWHLDLEAERGKSDMERANRYSDNFITNAETAAWHRSAKVALNLHRKMTYIETGGEIAAGSAESIGPRAYEIPAVGGFMLCDDERPELFDVLGDSAATFRAWDRDDLSRQLTYWLSHPDARERQQHAQAEAIRPHHWGNRAREVLEFIIT